MAVSSSVLPWHQVQGGATATTRNDIKSWARRVLGSESYRARVEKEAIAGTLPTAVETLLYHYAYGKPVEQIQLKVTPGETDYDAMSLEDLKEHMGRLESVLDEALELEAAIPAEYRVA